MKTGRLLLILVLVLVGIIIFVNKCNNKKADAAANNKAANAILMTLNGVVVSLQSLNDNIYCTGTFLSNDEVEIRNEVPGRIVSINFNEGSKVKKGDLLVKLYDEDLKAQLKKLLLQKDLAAKTLERQKDLLTIKGISQQDYELAENQLSSVNADIDLINTSISKTEIRASFNGVIGLRTVSNGAFLAMNTLIAKLQDIDPLKIEFSIPERYRNMITEGTEINFTTESAKGMFKGKIYAFEPKIDLQTRTFTVRALYQNPEHLIFPGAFAKITVPLRQISNTILVPTQAVVPELKGESIYVFKDGKANKMKVETGLRNDSTLQITSGLSAGDTVLTNGIMQLHDKMQVNVKVVN